jgi:hypothetical protein
MKELGLLEFVRHPCESRGPALFGTHVEVSWVPAFAGMTD